MAFEWKAPKDIFKGEGIYHLTFVVAGRRRLLGELVEIPHDSAGEGTFPYGADVARLRDSEGLTLDNANLQGGTNNGTKSDTASLPYKGWRKDLSTSELATVRLSPIATDILHDLLNLPSRYAPPGTPDEEKPLKICCKQFMPSHLHVVIYVKKNLDKSIRQIAQGFRIGIRKIANEKYDWKREDGHFFEKPFIRTLSHYSQLPEMIRYVHANPDSKWREIHNPDLYVIRRNQVHGGLTFDCMGKERLLDYPDRQVIALSRSLTAKQIEAEVRKALWRAERGVVTYCAAMNEGEKAVTKAIREGGYPLVVMMLEGFPPEGSEAARFFHPGGVYHKMCGDGLLYLMAPHAGNYENRELMASTDAELKRKDEEKGYTYRPLPHDSKRWRMIAGNVMLRMVSGQVCVDTA